MRSQRCRCYNLNRRRRWGSGFESGSIGFWSRPSADRAVSDLHRTRSPAACLGGHAEPSVAGRRGGLKDGIPSTLNIKEENGHSGARRERICAPYSLARSHAAPYSATPTL
ncbi:hypothetical protein EVAR_35579_1 [Eumeta japonica]|uniref:Uncharacterized protein n=1 Tax=Eumeta variegata TaxID=151549 RepID=A0A4C1XM50_EUMVA|nr:hypothetical protein EVAR_35579_1 [Eumeta japonica]